MEETKKKLMEWLKGNKDYLRLAAIEKKIECSHGTLQKVSTGERQLADQWVEPLKSLLDKMDVVL